MKKNNKKIKLFSLIFLILFCLYFQTVVYSAINSTMTIKGDAYARVDADVRITGFNVYNISSDSKSNYEEYGKDNISTSVSLPYSDSYIIYKIDVTNYGANAGIYSIEGLPNNLSYELIDYNLSDKLCDSSGNCSYGIVSTFFIKIKYNSYDSNNSNYDINLTFEFRNVYTITYSNIDNNNYKTFIMNNEALNMTLVGDIPNKINVYVDGIEIDRSTYVYNNRNGSLVIDNVSGDLVIEKAESTLLPGQTFTKQLKDFVNGTTDATYSSTESLVTYIGVFEDHIPDGYTKEEFLNLPSLEVSENGRVKAYNDNGKIYIYSIDDILANIDSYSLFRGYTKLTELNILELDTKNVWSAQAMFSELRSLKTLDLSNFNSSNIGQMTSMFNGCSSLEELDLSHFDTSNVRAMNSMFWNCTSLKNLDVTGFNTSKVNDMAVMFGNCTSLTSIDVSSFDTSNVTTMYQMFYESNLTKIDISNFNTSKVTNMNRMFRGNDNLEKIYVGDGWDISAVTDSEKMFFDSTKLPNYDANYVDVTKAYVGEGGYLSYPPKTFNIDGVAYKYEEGMTWRDWVDSSYDTRGFVNNNDLIYTDDLMYALVYEEDNGSYTSYSWPYIDDLIDPNLVYVTFNEAGEDGEW